MLYRKLFRISQATVDDTICPNCGVEWGEHYFGKCPNSWLRR